MRLARPASHRLHDGSGPPVSKLIDLVNAGQWRDLFIEELGWTRPTLKPLVIPVENENEEYDVTLTEVAQYKGVRVWVCNDAARRAHAAASSTARSRSTRPSDSSSSPTSSSRSGAGRRRATTKGVGKTEARQPPAHGRARQPRAGAAASPDRDRGNREPVDPRGAQAAPGRLRRRSRHEGVLRQVPEAPRGPGQGDRRSPDYQPERTDEDRKPSTRSASGTAPCC